MKRSQSFSHSCEHFTKTLGDEGGSSLGLFEGAGESSGNP